MIVVDDDNIVAVAVLEVVDGDVAVFVLVVVAVVVFCI